MKVLLVDDEKKFAVMLSKRLALRGFNADYALTGEEAVKKAESSRYDVAILDVKMPGLGGIDLERSLNGLHPDMKFIFVTGHGSEDDFKVGAAEASYYLAKPLQIDVLVKILHEITE
jgi:DNA-binding response OmpR family regulator